MDYPQTIDYIYSLERFGIKLGLQNMKYLDKTMGGPAQVSDRYIHITGTNGKGTCSEVTAALLTALGNRAGCFTSPHIEDFAERMHVDGKWVPQGFVIDFIKRYRPIFELMDGMDQVAHPTFFEVVTAMAFDHFHQQNVSKAVIEVGLGGRLDATNIISHPICTVITSVGLDHTMQLGEDLDSIAWEKSGIIKPGHPVVIGFGPEGKDEGPFEVINREAEKKGAPLLFLTRSEDLFRSTDNSILVTPKGVEEGFQSFSLTIGEDERDYTTRLLGDHQINNVALALVATSMGVGNTEPSHIDDESVLQLLAKFTIPGRFEQLRVPRGRDVILDICHNPQAAQALVETVQSIHPYGVDLIFSSMKDKETEKVLEVLSTIVHNVHIAHLDLPRARAVDEMEDIVKEAIAVDMVSTIISDEDLVNILGTSDRPMLITGSLFLISRVRPVVLGMIGT